MISKVAILITNYNMPERCDALVEHIKRTVKWPYRLFVVDNGSDLVEPSKHTNVFIRTNRQTTGGWLAGLDAADKYREDYLGYWFLITSAEFVDGIDPLTPLAELLIDDPSAVGVHPALTENSTTAWEHLKTRGGCQQRPVKMIDNISALWRADWLDEIGRFDKKLIYGWGIDLETSWFARKQGRGMYVHEGSRVRKITDIGYQMDRMNMTAEKRRELATANMEAVLSERYGPDWWNRMINEYVTEQMK